VRPARSAGDYASDLPPAAPPLRANKATQRAAAKLMKALAKVGSPSVTQLHCCTSRLSASVNPSKQPSGLARFGFHPVAALSPVAAEGLGARLQSSLQDRAATQVT
jgi:hypothetical protein